MSRLPKYVLAKAGGLTLPTRAIRHTIHMYHALTPNMRKAVDNYLRRAAGLTTKSSGRWVIKKAKRGERRAGHKYLARIQVGTNPDGSIKYKYIRSYGQLAAHLSEDNLKDGTVLDAGDGTIQINARDKKGNLHIVHTDKRGKKKKRTISAKDLAKELKDKLKGNLAAAAAKKKREIKDAKTYGSDAQVAALEQELGAIYAGATGGGAFNRKEIVEMFGDEDWIPAGFAADTLHEEVLPDFPEEFFPEEDLLKSGEFVAYRHQAEASARINASWDERDGFVLMDTAGLGKTIEALMAIRQRGGKRNLIVVPTNGKANLKSHWTQDGKLLGVNVSEGVQAGDGTFVVSYDELYDRKVRLDAFTADPGFTEKQLEQLAKFDGDDRRLKRAEAIQKMFKGMDEDVAYAIAMGLQDYAELKPEMKNFDTIAFDEAHSMQNPDSLRSQAAVELQLNEMGAEGGDCKMLYMSATPFTTIRDTHYLRGLGWFRTGAEFVQWAEGAGAEVKRKSRPVGDLPFEIVPPGTPVPTAIVSAQMHVEGAGMKRTPRYDEGESRLNARFSKHAIKRQDHKEMFMMGEEVASIAREALKSAGEMSGSYMIGGMMTMWRKQAWELVKADDAIQHAKDELDKGRQVALFTEYTRHDHAALGGGKPSKKNPHGSGLAAVLRKRAHDLEVDKNGKKRKLNPAQKATQKMLRRSADQIDGVVQSMFTENIHERMAKELSHHIGAKGIKKNKKGEITGPWHEHVAQIHGQARDADGNLIGRGRDDSTKKDLAAYMGSKKDKPTKRICVASMAKGGTGLSYHDKHGHAPRTQINLSLPWHAVGFDQVSGRSHRLGSQSDTEMVWMHGNDASEHNLARIVSDKLGSMGALVAGDPGGKVDAVVRAMFESGHNLSAEEQARIMHSIETGIVDADSPHAESIKQVLDTKDATKRSFQAGVDRLREGGNPIEEFGRMYKNVNAAKAYVADETNRIAAGQLTAQYGVRIEPDPDSSMRLRVHPGNLPSGAQEAFARMRGVNRYPDGSFSVGDPSSFFGLALRIDAKNHRYVPGKTKLGKNVQLFSGAYGKVFAPKSWSSADLAENHKEWTEGAPKGGHHTHTEQVKAVHGKRHAALVKQRKTEYGEAASREVEARRKMNLKVDEDVEKKAAKFDKKKGKTKKSHGRAAFPARVMKAKYTKRWKGPDGKWQYEYAKPAKEGLPPRSAEAAKEHAAQHATHMEKYNEAYKKRDHAARKYHGEMAAHHKGMQMHHEGTSPSPEVNYKQSMKSKRKAERLKKELDKTAPKKTAPKKTAPKKTAPKETAPKETAPKKTTALKKPAGAPISDLRWEKMSDYERAHYQDGFEHGKTNRDPERGHGHYLDGHDDGKKALKGNKTTHRVKDADGNVREYSHAKFVDNFGPPGLYMPPGWKYLGKKSGTKKSHGAFFPGRIAKGKGLPPGTIRTHGGVKKQKQGDGSWKPVSEGKSGKKKDEPKDKRVGKQDDPKAPKGKKADPKGKKGVAKDKATKKKPAKKVQPLGYIPDELKGRTDVTIDEVEKHGGIQAVLGHLKVSPLPAMGGENPVNRADITFDFSGDLDSKAVIKWRDATANRNAKNGYTEVCHKRNANAKWDRTRKLRPEAPRIGDRARAIADDDGRSDAERDSALIISITQQTGIRPGSLASAKGERGSKGATFGITTLRPEHVTIKGDTITMKFIGKSSEPNHWTLQDPQAAAYLKERMQTADQRDGFIFDHNPNTTKALMKECGGEGYKLKDFRTVVGTRVGAMALASHPAPPPPLPENAKKAKKMVKDAVKKASEIVGKTINNKPATALKSYVSPSVVRAWVKHVGGSQELQDMYKAEDANDEPMADEEQPQLDGDEGITEKTEAILDDADETPPYPEEEGPEPTLSEPDDEDEDEELESYPTHETMREDEDEEEGAEEEAPSDATQDAEVEKSFLPYFDGFFGPGPLDRIIKGDPQSPSGPGWQPVPGGKHGGYRRKRGERYEYWYPSSAHAARAAKHHQKKGERMRKKLGKVLKKRGAKQEHIEKFLDEYDHHSNVGDAAHSHSQSADRSTSDSLKTALQDHHGLSEEQAGRVMSQLGKLIDGMAGNGKPKASEEGADQGGQDPKKEEVEPPEEEKTPQEAKADERKAARDAVKHAEGQKKQDQAMMDQISQIRAKLEADQKRADERMNRPGGPGAHEDWYPKDPDRAAERMKYLKESIRSLKVNPGFNPEAGRKQQKQYEQELAYLKKQAKGKDPGPKPKRPEMDLDAAARAIHDVRKRGEEYKKKQERGETPVTRAKAKREAKKAKRGSSANVKTQARAADDERKRVGEMRDWLDKKPKAKIAKRTPKGTKKIAKVAKKTKKRSA